jgi:hypothetical protein
MHMDAHHQSLRAALAAIGEQETQVINIAARITHRRLQTRTHKVPACEKASTVRRARTHHDQFFLGSGHVIPFRPSSKTIKTIMINRLNMSEFVLLFDN